jgi:superfamily II DNA/RNA helicase
VQALAQNILRNPVRIAVAAAPSGIPDIVQRAIEVDAGRRTQLLRHLIEEQAWERTLVFVATKYAADIVALKLQRAGISAGAFHGDLSQGARTQLLAEFKNTKLRVLVATDVAARGIDIVQLPAVINYDLPRSTVEYTHRIGRTGRAGASGVAISFISADSADHFRLIEQRRQMQLPRERIAGFEPVETVASSAPDLSGLSAEEKSAGGVKGRRKSKKDKLREAAAAASLKA